MIEFDFKIINPYIRVAINSVLQAGRTINRRVILDYELVYVKNGKFTLEYIGAEYSCKKGDLILIHPGVSHSFKNITSDLSQPHIHFDMIYSFSRAFKSHCGTSPVKFTKDKHPHD